MTCNTNSLLPMSSRLLAFVLLTSTPLLIKAGQLTGDTATYSVEIKGCPSKLSLSIPKEFVVASTPSAIELRTSMLSALNRPFVGQPYAKAKAHTAEIFMIAWDSESSLPRIQILSLGSVQKHQGRITPDSWAEAKKAIIKVNKAERNRRFQKLKQHYEGLGGTVDTMWFEPYEEDNKTIVVKTIGSIKFHDNEEELKYISGGKVVYVKNCIASVVLYIDLDTPDVFTILDGYMELISIE